MFNEDKKIYDILQLQQMSKIINDDPKMLLCGEFIYSNCVRSIRLNKIIIKAEELEQFQSK